MVKQPKLYFCDPGLAASLLGIEKKEQLVTHYLKGGLFETMVITELLKYRMNRGLQPHLYFWRDNKGNEVDCILEHENKLIPIEIKAGKTIATDFFKGLDYWIKIATDKAGQPYLIYGGNEVQKRSLAQVITWHDSNRVYEY